MVVSTESVQPEMQSASRRNVPASGSLLFLILERYGLVVLLIALFVAFSLTQDSFFSVRNMQVIALSVSTATFLSMALLIPIVAGKFDLSVGSVAVLGTLVAARCMSDWGIPLVLVFPITILTGVLIGVVNGLLVTRAGVNDFVATLGMATILVGVTSWFSQDRAFTTGFSQVLMDFGRGQFLGVPLLAIAAAVMALVTAYLLRQTKFGRRLAAIGSNESAANLVGVRVDSTVTISYMISGGIAALAGVLMVSAQGSATPALQGFGILIPALAAVFLGASVFVPGRFNVPGTLVGLIVVAIAVSGMTLGGVPAWVSNLVNGGLLIGAVAASQYFKRRRGDRG